MEEKSPSEAIWAAILFHRLHIELEPFELIEFVKNGTQWLPIETWLEGVGKW